MSQEMIVQLIRESMQVALIISGPLLIVAMVAGLAVSIIQVVTSIHDPTLSSVPRIAAIGLVLLITMPWMIQKMTMYTDRLFSQLLIYAK